MWAIKSNHVVLPGKMIAASVVLEGDRIIDVVTDDSLEIEHIIDIGDNVLMPGIVDPHVHINEPGRTDWEGFDTATHAALSGGITTLVEMPLNASPVTTSVAAFHAK